MFGRTGGNIFLRELSMDVSYCKTLYGTSKNRFSWEERRKNAFELAAKRTVLPAAPLPRRVSFTRFASFLLEAIAYISTELFGRRGRARHPSTGVAMNLHLWSDSTKREGWMRSHSIAADFFRTRCDSWLQIEALGLRFDSHDLVAQRSLLRHCAAIWRTVFTPDLSVFLLFCSRIAHLI